jgi:uncharacterized membrane protein YfcA
MNSLIYIILGLVAGIFGGMFGLGGGLIIIPALVYFAGFTQLQAQGTNLFIMLPPIGLLAALRYYYKGNVKLNVAVFICLGFLIGGLIGAQLVQNLPDALLKRMFGILLLIVSIKMILAK